MKNNSHCRLQKSLINFKGVFQEDLAGIFPSVRSLGHSIVFYDNYGPLRRLLFHFSSAELAASNTYIL